MLHSRISYCPEDTCHMPQPCAAQHQGTIPVGDRPRHPRPPTDLTVQSLDHFAGTDAHPILAGKVAVDHCLFNASFNPLRRFLQLHLPQLIDNNFHLLAEGFIALLYMNCLKCIAMLFSAVLSFFIYYWHHCMVYLRVSSQNTSLPFQSANRSY